MSNNSDNASSREGAVMESMNNEYGSYSKSQQQSFLLVKDRVMQVVNNKKSNSQRLVFADYGMFVNTLFMFMFHVLCLRFAFM